KEKGPVSRDARMALKAENRRWPKHLKRVPLEDWPRSGEGETPWHVFRSCDFLVQVFKERYAIRITVNRTELRPDGDWKADITWDELQSIKQEIGFDAWWAVELYPPSKHVVNV